MLTGQKIGPFIVEEEIGSGAMGVVYRGRYTKNEQPVAIKIISSGQDTNPTAIARFERETTILKRLDHPNIVKLYATGRLRGCPFYVMEYIHGETLEKILERRQRFTWEEVVTLGQQVCSALQHAHEQGVVHRDLKPANIMMLPDGNPKLMDFGIAKGLEVSQLTATNHTVGTASYMSPEQCRGEKTLTNKSDIYSLGVVFYELITGVRPFQAETTLDMFLAHAQAPFERPSRIVLDIPVWLDTLICQMLEKEPERRPLDANMVARSLGMVLEKVNAQKSAGVELANARRVDLPREKRLTDETDKEAARLLRTGTTKKKAKRKTKPFYEKAWFVVLAVAALLATVSGLTYRVLKPPAPEVLFGRAKLLMSSTDPDDWWQAREGPIQDYLKRYQERDDSQTRQVQAWADQVDVQVRERQLRSRMKMKITPDSKAEEVAQSAVRLEEDGDLAGAADRWHSLLDFNNKADPEERTWGLLADKRLRDLARVDEIEQELRKKLDKARADGEEFQSPVEAEVTAARGLNYEDLEDWAMAKLKWNQLKQPAQGSGDARAWGLLAARKSREAEAKLIKDLDEERQNRIRLVQTHLDEAAKAKKKGDVDGARAYLTDIVVLYGDSAGGTKEIQKLVAEARRLRNTLPKRIH